MTAGQSGARALFWAAATEAWALSGELPCLAIANGNRDFFDEFGVQVPATELGGYGNRAMVRQGN